MLFDTTFLIDIERETRRDRQGSARSFLRQNPNVPLFVSVISVYETRIHQLLKGKAKSANIKDTGINYDIKYRLGRDIEEEE